MIFSFTERQINILTAMSASAPLANKTLLDKVFVSELTFHEIDAVCGIINNEFMMKGLLPNYEPNEYGLELEKLLDVINKPRIC